MRISEFVDNMSKRFDSKLSSPDQVNSFLDDCKIHLKKYEGEVLGYAFHEIVAINGTRTHPVISKIRKICSQKESSDHKAVNPVSEETAQWIKNKKMVDDFKQTESFKWAAQRMIGIDVLLHIERKGDVPNKSEVDAMLRAHEEFKVVFRELDNEPDPTPTQLMLYKTGKALNEKNLDYFHAHIGQ